MSYTDMFGKEREMPGVGGNTSPLVNPNQQALQTSLAGPQTYEGFDRARAQDPRRSAKDAFLELSGKAPTAPTNDKNALGAWFNQYILPGMNEYGHGAQQAQGDKFRFKNWQGEFDVDYGRGAGAEGGALAWQADDANAPMAQAGGGSPVNHLMSQPRAGSGGGLLDAIMASLQSQQEPNAQALLQQALG